MGSYFTPGAIMPSPGDPFSQLLNFGLGVVSQYLQPSVPTSGQLGGGVPYRPGTGAPSLIGEGPSQLPSGLGRRRRMNVLNPYALRRSMRRVQGFAKFAKRTITFTKKVKMKKRRRS